jgi:DNA-binding NtrC family response regulator
LKYLREIDLKMNKNKLVWLTNGIASETRDEWNQLKHEFEASPASNLPDAAEMLQSERIDCVLVVGTASIKENLGILEVLHSAAPSVPIVFLGREMTAAEAVQLVRNGAHNCFGLTDSLDELRSCVEDACTRKRRKDKQRTAVASDAWKQLLIGESPAMQDVFNTISLIGPRRCTVLINGETGTGKEMAARALHLASPRAQKPMVALNCCALPEHLLEAELFGHVKGAFTGATSHRTGRFEQANKGTLFLDEIGDMPLELQAKLLRVVQEREIQPLGSSVSIPIDVRLIAATNCNLPERVAQGRFREDLYYRLNVVPVTLPPLRKRRSDIRLLVDHFIAKSCQNEGISEKQISPDAVERLCQLPWPGNVRQLENTVEMAIALCGDRNTLYPADFGISPMLQVVPPPATRDVDESVDFETAVSRFEKTILDQALSKTGGNKTAAAELLGLKRTTLIMKIRNLQGSVQLQPAV